MFVVLNALFPVFALLAMGRLLKNYGFTDARFLQQSDRIIYYVFFPLLLFWKIGGADQNGGIPWNFCMAVLCTVLVIFILGAVYIRFRVDDFEAGAFSQSCYRFNTYIGMAVILNVLGDEGVRLFGVMVGFAIPFINMLAVSTLIWHSGKTYKGGERLRLTLRALISNPLIVACVAGILYARTGWGFAPFVDGTFRLTTAVTLPLALLSVGGGLTFGTLKAYIRPSLAGAFIKLVLFPLTGYASLRLFHVGGTAFQTGMIFFALPTSTAIYVLSSQLSSNTDLASASIGISTVLSFISLTVILAGFAVL